MKIWKPRTAHEVEAHYRNTLAHIRGMQQAEATRKIQGDCRYQSLDDALRSSSRGGRGPQREEIRKSGPVRGTRHTGGANTESENRYRALVYTSRSRRRQKSEEDDDNGFAIAFAKERREIEIPKAPASRIRTKERKSLVFFFFFSEYGLYEVWEAASVFSILGSRWGNPTRTRTRTTPPRIPSVRSKEEKKRILNYSQAFFLRNSLS